jgi:flagellar assembly factor FliW
MSTHPAAPSSDIREGCAQVEDMGRQDPSQDTIFLFPQGILGFPSCKRFRLAPADAEGFYWLQSLECDSLAFLTVDPFRAIDDFIVDLPDTDLHHLQTTHAPEIGVMAIVTLPGSPGDAPTANLQGIVAFNFSKRIGRQIIIHDSPYGTRWPLDLQHLSLAS